MRLAHSLILLACALVPLAVIAQHGSHQGTTANNPPPAEPPVESPDLTTFKHEVAVAATTAQAAQFHEMAQTMATARQHARALKQLSNPSDVSVAIRQATALQDDVDEVRRANRKFVESFSDSQDAGLKPLTKRLIKSDAAVTKEGNRLDEQLDEIPVDTSRLASTAASLEKSLRTLQASQLRLAREMGIVTH